MIDKNKTYRTRNGREVRVYATDHSGGYCVLGAYKGGDDGWWTHSWLKDGIDPSDNDFDLIEVTPRIKRTVWVNLYKTYHTSYPTEGLAHEDRLFKIKNSADCIACVKVEIDCKEGEGL